MIQLNRRWAVVSLLCLLLACFAGLQGGGKPSNDFRFSILGDRTGGATPQIYGRVWREIDLLHPDFVINVGDTIQGGDDSAAEAQWQQVRWIWQRYGGYPLYLVPGNHDVWNDFSRKLFEKVTGRRSFYSFDYQNAHFAVLDNSRTLDLSETQLDFLEQDLKEHRDRSPKFIFFHKPYWIVFLKLGSGEFRLHQLAKTYGVGHVISGHGHQFARFMRDGVVYMEVGSSGANISAKIHSGEGFSQGRFYHHVWGTVKGSDVRLTVKEIDGSQGKGRMFRAEDWDEHGPKFDPEDPALTDKPGT